MTATPATAESRQDAKKRFDVFIAHAHEDKADAADPLAKALASRGLAVWYDDYELKVGDSLRRRIDEGLLGARYGVVVLSEKFFEKEWPQKELDGLVGMEVDGRKVVLPVWHKIGRSEVARHSPLLADRMAANTTRGIEQVADAILRAVRD